MKKSDINKSRDELINELNVLRQQAAKADDLQNRLADLGQMASHVAHEVRNNLTPLTLYLSLLRRRVADNPLDSSAGPMRVEVVTPVIAPTLRAELRRIR